MKKFQVGDIVKIKNIDETWKKVVRVDKKIKYADLALQLMGRITAVSSVLPENNSYQVVMVHFPHNDILKHTNFAFKTDDIDHATKEEIEQFCSLEVASKL